MGEAIEEVMHSASSRPPVSSPLRVALGDHQLGGINGAVCIGADPDLVVARFGRRELDVGVVAVEVVIADPLTRRCQHDERGVCRRPQTDPGPIGRVSDRSARLAYRREWGLACARGCADSATPDAHIERPRAQSATSCARSDRSHALCSKSPRGFCQSDRENCSSRCAISADGIAWCACALSDFAQALSVFARGDASPVRGVAAGARRVSAWARGLAASAQGLRSPGDRGRNTRPASPS